MRDSKGRFVRGKPPFNKGKPWKEWMSVKGMKLAGSAKQLHSEKANHKRIVTMTGRTFTPEHRKHISEARIGMKFSKAHRHSLKIAQSTPELKRLRSLSRSRQVFPKYDTGIERIVHSFLISKNLSVSKRKVFKLLDGTYHPVDRYLDDCNMAIECDGKYWHSKPEAIERDNLINRSLVEQGVHLLRLSEEDINSGRFVPIIENALLVGDFS